MKRLLFSLLLIAVGGSFWWLLSRTAQFSIKKWDAKFETVLRHGLDQVGASNTDVVSSVHEVRKDATGEWVVYRLSVRLKDPAKRRKLEDSLRSAGADVSLRKGAESVLVVRRRGRVYQEITFVAP